MFEVSRHIIISVFVRMPSLQLFAKSRAIFICIAQWFSSLSSKRNQAFICREKALYAIQNDMNDNFDFIVR